MIDPTNDSTAGATASAEAIEIVKLSPAQTEAATAKKPRGRYAETYNEILKLKPGESLKIKTPTPSLQAMNTLWCRLHRAGISGFTFRRLDEFTLVAIRLTSD